MNPLFLISSILLFLPALSSEKYTYLLCEGWLRGSSYSPGSGNKVISHSHKMYITIDERKSRINFSQKPYSLNEWEKARISRDTIYLKTKIHQYTSDFSLIRSSGNYVLAGEIKTLRFRDTSIAKGVCRKY